MDDNEHPTEAAAPIIMINERRTHRLELSSAQLIKVLRKRASKHLKKCLKTIEIPARPPLEE
jgi:hypothetical protein